MAKRKSMPKGLRFEVFKRDAFKCQYCGRSAPDVILEVDHIKPVASGGTNELINLVTSCRDCNRGKGKKNLSDTSTVERQRKQLEDLNEIREQTEMMIMWKKSLMEVENKQVTAIEDYIAVAVDAEITETGRKKLHSLIQRFGFSEVYDATIIAFNKYSDTAVAFDKIGGICYNRKWGIRGRCNAKPNY